MARRFDVDLKGLIAATVTPMHADHSVDLDTLRRYLLWLVDEGVRGVAVNVDTGETAHLYPHERLQIIELAAEVIPDDVALIAGLAATFDDQAQEVARRTADAGARGLLVFPIPAYLGQPLDPEIPASYHRAIAEACDLPLIAFQLQPQLGGVNFSTDALERVLAIDSVVAIKEASFDAKRFVETRSVAESVDPEIVVLNGNDNLLFETYVLGAHGALLGFGTIAARQQVEMLEAYRSGDVEQAREVGKGLQRLADTFFAPPVSSYRARIKFALCRLGVLSDPSVRPPLRQLDNKEQACVDGALERAGLT